MCPILEGGEKKIDYFNKSLEVSRIFRDHLLSIHLYKNPNDYSSSNVFNYTTPTSLVIIPSHCPHKHTHS